MKTLIKQCISLTMLIWGGWTVCCWAGGTPGNANYKVSDLTFKKTDQAFVLTIKGEGTPTFTTYQLFDPLRVVIDIANASLADSLTLPLEINEAPVAQITGKMLTEKKPFISKLQILLTEDWRYKIERQSSDIEIKFLENGKNGKQKVTSSQAGAKVVKTPVVKKMPAIQSMKVKKLKNGGLKVLLVTGEPIGTFTKVNLPKGHGRPDRFYLDIPGVTASGMAPIREMGAGPLARIRMAKRKTGVRIVFDSATDHMFPYEVASDPNGLLVTIHPVPGEAATAPPTQKLEAGVSKTDAVGGLLAKLTSGQQKNPASVSAVKKTAMAHATVPQDTGAVKAQLENVGITGDAFADAGYKKQKISVDFYKIDLHNVFRLIGEVSGYNIVVDDSVKGTLTLSLKDVPWDFVLDVIMNLKDLQKEERYNTIVISPKAKNFSWPEKKKKTELAIEAPSGQLQVKIDKQLAQPPEALEANLIVQQADILAKAGKFKEALQQYEAAFDKWPKNGDLARQIANICLVDLGYNQKAVDYAKKALALNSQDREAALQAAVGLANMKQTSARRYFEQAVSGKLPARAALVSYAGYLENQADLAKALEILGKYEVLYGSDLDTMIAKARIYDKLKQPKKAVAEYQAIMYSGYSLDPDLARYIKGRIAIGAKP